MKLKIGRIVEKFDLNKQRFVIRHLHWRDVEKLRNFANKISKEDTFVMLSGEEITIRQEVEYIANSIAQIESNKKIHLVITCNGKIVGNAEVRPDQRRRDHIGHFTIAIDSDFRGKGLATILLQHVISESKNLGLRMLMLEVFEINKAGIKVYERAGFIKYGMVPGALLYKGEYVNELYYYLPLV